MNNKMAPNEFAKFKYNFFGLNENWNLTLNKTHLDLIVYQMKISFEVKWVSVKIVAFIISMKTHFSFFDPNLFILFFWKHAFNFKCRYLFKWNYFKLE